MYTQKCRIQKRNDQIVYFDSLINQTVEVHPLIYFTLSPTLNKCIFLRIITIHILKHYMQWRDAYTDQRMSSVYFLALK